MSYGLKVVGVLRVIVQMFSVRWEAREDHSQMYDDTTASVQYTVGPRQYTTVAASPAHDATYAVSDQQQPWKR